MQSSVGGAVVRQRIVLLLVVLAAPIVVWQGSMLAGRYYYGSLAQSPSPSLPEERPDSATSPQPTERTTASVAPAEETTAPEETTAFQAPEGTKASSTARIACLRQKEGAPLQTNGTEALDDGILTRVLTPKVEAHPDGVHLQIDLRLRKPAGYSISDARATPFERYSDGGYLRKGITNDVIQAPPSIAEIQCYPSENYDFSVRTYAYFEVVKGDSGYRSPELECKPGAPIAGGGIPTDVLTPREVPKG